MEISSSKATRSAQFYTEELNKHCRVCGRRFGRGARQEPKEKGLFLQCYPLTDDARMRNFIAEDGGFCVVYGEDACVFCSTSFWLYSSQKDL